MELRERRLDERGWGTPNEGTGAGDSGAIDETRAAGERFLRASDRAIERALSGNSQEFLKSSRQEGGQ